MITTVVVSVFVEGGAYTRRESRVTVSPFHIGTYPVTQAQYREIAGANPSGFDEGEEAPARPVENVTWHEAVAFCNALSQRGGLTPVYSGAGDEVMADLSANGWRLPTEAEWEYAARGGRVSRGCAYSGADDAGAVAWNCENSGDTTHAVGKKAANELGVHDMTGNVWEWCGDWYGEYPVGAQRDPAGPASGAERVTRGGSWRDSPDGSRVSSRYSRRPDYRGRGVGFRVLRRP